MSFSAHIHRGEFPVITGAEGEEWGGGGKSGRRGETECPSRSIVFGYHTTRERREGGRVGGKSDSAGK